MGSAEVVAEQVKSLDVNIPKDRGFVLIVFDETGEDQAVSSSANRDDTVRILADALVALATNEWGGVLPRTKTSCPRTHQ